MEVDIMMMKKEFINKVNEDLGTAVRHVNKNNGVGYEGFSKVDVNVSPTVNVDNIYNIYETEGYEVAVEKLREILDKKPPIQDLKDFYNKLSNDRLTLKLVNYEANKDRLKNVVYKTIGDLAIELRVIVEYTEDGYATTSVTDSILESMGLSKEEAMQIAIDNGKGDVTLQDMLSLLLDIGADMGIDIDDVNYLEAPMYVLSNKNKLNGAIAMLYSEYLDKVCDKFDSDNVYIIPSSIHEVIVVNAKDTNPSDLNSLIAMANNTSVETEDILSYKLYEYKKGGLLQIAES
jgi:hypothetical protein